MTRRDFHACLIGLAASLILPPAGATEWVEGRDWQNLPVPAPKDAGGRILVQEFFSYGCPHCADLNPLITAWAAKLPKEARREPRAGLRNVTQSGDVKTVVTKARDGKEDTNADALATAAVPAVPRLWPLSAR